MLASRRFALSAIAQTRPVVPLCKNSTRNCLTAVAVPPPPVTFDTHDVVQKLEQSGFTRKQAAVVLDILKTTTEQALASQRGGLASQSQHVQVRAELNEKVFNSTLKSEIAQRHTRELLEKDLEKLKTDLRALETADYTRLSNTIHDHEKTYLARKAEQDERFSSMSANMERMEKRIMQYGLYLVLSGLGLLAGVARIMMMSGGDSKEPKPAAQTEGEGGGAAAGQQPNGHEDEHHHHQQQQQQ